MVKTFFICLLYEKYIMFPSKYFLCESLYQTKYYQCDNNNCFNRFFDVFSANK